MRIGHGFDAHRFGDGGRLVIGGVEIPYEKGVIAHSDGDVLIHAVCDALLGAAALGDIGGWFPDSCQAYEGADSRLFLRQIRERIQDEGYTVGNVDATVVAQAPKLKPYLADMRANLAHDLHLDSNAVNIKATTTEGMGFTGSGEGLAAHAVVLIKSLS